MTDLRHEIAEVWDEPGRVVPFIKGRVSLYAILRAAGVGPGDEVLMPGFTCVVVAAAVQYVGARPVFYDVVPRTYNGDPDLARAKIGPRTRVVLIQHSFGAPTFLSDLIDVCHDRGIRVIEDCAHALGARYADRPAGLVGDAAFTSLQWSKTVTTGLGGLARLNDDELARNMDEIVASEFDEPSLAKSISLSVLSAMYHRFFTPERYWKARASYRAIAGLGLVQGSSSDEELLDPAMPPGYRELFGHHRLGELKRVLEGAAASVVHRRNLAERYDDWCRERGIRTQERPAGSTTVALRYPLLVRNRAVLLDAAREDRIEIGNWFDGPLHPSEADASVFGYRTGECPLAERLCDTIINLPTHPGVKAKDVSRVLTFMDRHLDMVIRDPDELRET